MRAPVVMQCSMCPGEVVCDSLSLPLAESGITMLMNPFQSKGKLLLSTEKHERLDLGKQPTQRPQQHGNVVAQGEKHCSCARFFLLKGVLVCNLWI